MSNKPIFSVRIEDQNPVHTRVTVFNYGGNSGTLVINTNNADEFIRRVTGGVGINQQADIVTGTMVGAVIGKI